jgi:hypothetical protein
MKPFQIAHRTAGAAAVVLLGLVATEPVRAQEGMPGYGTIVTGAQAAGVWYTDRYAPAAFEDMSVFQGRDDVLRIGISQADGSGNRPGNFSSMFYNTQGRKHDVAIIGSFTLSADLWMDASWAASTNGHRRTDIWATAVDAGNVISAYPILGFTNQGGIGQFRGWDPSGAWIDFTTPVMYDAWNSLQIAFDADASIFNYFVNGALLGTVAGGSTAGLSNVIMQAYNFDACFVGFNADLNNYDAHWSNTQAQQVVPEPVSMILLVTGLAGIGAVSSRRRRKNGGAEV